MLLPQHRASLTDVIMFPCVCVCVCVCVPVCACVWAVSLLQSMGDYCLLAGSPRDAADHYSASITVLRSVDDHMWHAGACEGLAAANVSTHVLGSESRPPRLSHEVVEKCVRNPWSACG